MGESACLRDIHALMALSAGARLGPYDILSALGAGGMGEVYRARDTHLDRTVAIKVLAASLVGDPGPQSGADVVRRSWPMSDY